MLDMVMLSIVPVLQDAGAANEIGEEEAARVAKDILFHTANLVYQLELGHQ